MKLLKVLSVLILGSSLAPGFANARFNETTNRGSEIERGGEVGNGPKECGARIEGNSAADDSDFQECRSEEEMRKNNQRSVIPD